MSSSATTRQLVRFAFTTLAVSASFWGAGVLSQAFLLTPELPVSALMFTAPGLGLIATVGPRQAWSELHAMASSVRGTLPGAALWLPVMPLVVLATTHHTLAGDFAAALPLASLILLSVGLVISSMLEQLGWMWFAVRALARRWGTWPASVTTGAFWAVLHLVPWLQAGHDVEWIIGQSIFSVIFFCLIVQTYLPRRQLLTAVAMQWSYDATWVWVRSAGATYDPFATTLVTAALLITAAMRPRSAISSVCTERQTTTPNRRYP